MCVGLCNYLQRPAAGQVSLLSFPNMSDTNSPTPDRMGSLAGLGERIEPRIWGRVHATTGGSTDCSTTRLLTCTVINVCEHSKQPEIIARPLGYTLSMDYLLEVLDAEAADCGATFPLSCASCWSLRINTSKTVQFAAVASASPTGFRGRQCLIRFLPVPHWNMVLAQWAFQLGSPSRHKCTILSRAYCWRRDEAYSKRVSRVSGIASYQGISSNLCSLSCYHFFAIQRMS